MDRRQSLRRWYAIPIGCLAAVLVPLNGVLGESLSASAATAEHRTQRWLRLTEAATCDAVAAPPSPPGAGANTQLVTVAVPATVIVRVDGFGRVVAATTNTGCAPRSEDEYFLRLPDGALVGASADEFATSHWRGDFSTSGVEVRQVRKWSGRWDGVWHVLRVGGERGAHLAGGR